MSQAAYSDLKAAWHLDELKLLRQGRQIVPKQVQLIISDLCNHDCHFCAYRMTGGFSTEQFGEDTGRGFTMNPNRKIPTVKALEILDDCKRLGVKAIQFTGGGEPTVHPDHLKIIRHAQNLGLETSLVTNGYLLKPGWEDVFSQLAWLRVSVDAGTPETYARVRSIGLDAFVRTLKNLREIVRVTRGTPCLLGVGYVVTQENWSELVAACRLFRDLGVPYVRIAAMFSKDGTDYYDKHHEDIRAVVAEARHLDTDEFKIVDLFGDRMSDLIQHAPDYEFCGYEQFNMYIGGNLKVYRCCTTSYTKHGEVGDLSEQRLYDWFQSEQKRERYENFDARTCQVCQFNGKNRVINYMLQKEPMHVNYV